MKLPMESMDNVEKWTICMIDINYTTAISYELEIKVNPRNNLCANNCSSQGVCIDGDLIIR
jgi:hypothetical protein